MRTKIIITSFFMTILGFTVNAANVSCPEKFTYEEAKTLRDGGILKKPGTGTYVFMVAPEDEKGFRENMPHSLQLLTKAKFEKNLVLDKGGDVRDIVHSSVNKNNPEVDEDGVPKPLKCHYTYATAQGYEYPLILTEKRPKDVSNALELLIKKAGYDSWEGLKSALTQLSPTEAKILEDYYDRR